MKELSQETGRRVTDVATLTRFPAVVRAALDGDCARDRFVPANGIVLSSTYRIKPPGDELTVDDEEEKQAFFRPWRAVYKSEGVDVVKYASRREDTAQSRIQGTHISGPMESDDSIIEQQFGELDNAGVEIGDSDARHVEDSVEGWLSKLGYLW